jgi:DNA polymerase-3 subunit chi
MPESTQVDFYLLARPGLDAGRLACRLALMAWERGHRTTVLTESEAAASELDELMWNAPDGRFLPHARDGSETAGQAPVRITAEQRLNEADVLINLCRAPVPDPACCNRLLEIVPHRKADREASREKYRYYRSQGLEPATHEISG